MTCQTVAEALVDLARGVSIGEGSAAAVESHIERCAACAARFERERSLTHGLRALRDHAADAIPTAAVETHLLAAFDAQHGHSSTGLGRSRTGEWLLIAAAACAIAALGAGWMWQGSRARAVSPVVAGAPQAQVANAPPPVDAQADLKAGGAGREAVVASVKAPRPTRIAKRAVQFAEFSPVPGAAGLPDFESGRIVRVELPLASLPAYGVEIVPDAARTPIEADLLVGQDGQARAIRLVTPSSEPGSKR